jgi:hypothetical protein
MLGYQPTQKSLSASLSMASRSATVGTSSLRQSQAKKVAILANIAASFR